MNNDMLQYVPLHVHSHFSLLDGAGSPQEFIDRAVELKLPALAITDHGTLAGHREFNELATAAGIKPVLGCEVYVCNDITDKTPSKERLPGDKLYYHMVLIAQSDTGLHNLNRLMELAWTDGFFVKPRVDWAMLERHAEGLIATSGCLSGPLAKYLENNDEQGAMNYLHEMQRIFDGRFYAEIMPHNPPEMNERIAWMAQESCVPIVVTPDCHHATPDQRVLNEIMLLLNTHAKPVDKRAGYPTSGTHLEKLDQLYGADRQMSFNKFDIYLLSAAEIAAAMSYMDDDVMQQAFDNTLRIADSVEPYTMPYGLDLLPIKHHPEPDKRLRELSFQGLNRLGLTDTIYIDRLNKELQVIKDKDFALYFLIVYNMINWALRKGINVGPGRGSSAGSLLCYVLGITKIDPIKYDLLFFRFINPARNDLPDIDIDIEDKRRDEVKAYLKRQYGNVAHITTWSTWADKGVVRDVARVFRVPLADVNVALRNVHTFEQFMRDPDIAWFRAKYPEVPQYAAELRGRIRGAGVHPAGMVVCKDSISNYAPIETRHDSRTKQRVTVIGLDKDAAERVGLVKIDVLGLRALSVLQDFADMTGVVFNDVTLDDPAVYADIAAGHTRGVFQLDAHAYTKLALDMRPADFNDLVVSNALVRPGAMNTIGKEYVARRHGKQYMPVHPIYDNITADTYGLVIYQEQVMQLCVELGGMSMSEADKVRKIIGKKRDRSEFDQWQHKFINGATQYIGVDAATRLWHAFEAHADYSFNKCTSGDTVVTKSSGGKHGSQQVTIKQLYNDWHHGNKSTMQKYRSRGVTIMGRDAIDGRIRPFRVVNVWQQGVQPLWKITLANGKSIKATSNHRHLTVDGWKQVDEITTTDRLACMGQREHFFNPTGGNAHIKNGRKKSYEYVKCRSRNRCERCGSTTGRLEIAHLDHDRKNNKYDNLMLLCNSCHKQYDWDTGRRKQRHSRGRPIEYSNVVSIEYVGEEQTYDLEMDSDDHSWVGNGIVTHNSHAVAYSTLSYWTAWAKRYYPLEYIYALIKNEPTQEGRTELFVEAQRLGIEIKLPHVDLSDETITIENGGLRLGLMDVKFVADKAAAAIIAGRPFDNYRNWEQYCDDNKRQLNSNITQSLDYVGALDFPDTDRPPLREKLYEHLGLPDFDVRDRWKYDAIADFDEQSPFVFNGMVRNVKRGNGWARAEIIDNTGICGLFVDENTELAAGNGYVMVVSGNNIVQHGRTLDALPAVDRWLSNQYDDDGQYIVAMKPRTTKSGKRIINVVYAERGELRTAMVFDKQFVRGMAKLKPGLTTKYKIGRLQDGTRYFNFN